jgi:hypothetical protein
MENGGGSQCAGEFRGDFHLEQVGQRFVHGFHILLDDLFALAAVGVRIDSRIASIA